MRLDSKGPKLLLSCENQVNEVKMRRHHGHIGLGWEHLREGDETVIISAEDVALVVMAAFRPAEMQNKLVGDW